MNGGSRGEAYENLHKTNNIFTDSDFSLSEEIINTSWNIEYETRGYLRRFFRNLKEPNFYIKKLFDLVDEINYDLRGTNDKEKIEVLNKKILPKMKYKKGVSHITQILDKNHGNCVALSSLYLCVSENIGLNNLYVINIPRHVFLRYSNGSEIINIECTKNGENKENEEYINDKKIKKYGKEIIERDVKIEKLPKAIMENVLENTYPNYK